MIKYVSKENVHSLSGIRYWWRQHGYPSDRLPPAIGLQTHCGPTWWRPYCGPSLWSLGAFISAETLSFLVRVSSCRAGQMSSSLQTSTTPNSRWISLQLAVSLVRSILSLFLTWCPHCQISSLLLITFPDRSIVPALNCVPFVPWRKRVLATAIPSLLKILGLK